MDILKVCRVCLEMDITLYNLRSYSLEHHYELLTGINPLKQLKQAMFACYECAALLRKFFIFRQKSLRAQALLHQILLRSGQITEEEVKDVDKQYFVLSTRLKLALNVAKINIYPGTEDNDSKIKFKSNATKSVGRKKLIESAVDDSDNSTMDSEISISPTMMNDTAYYCKDKDNLSHKNANIGVCHKELNRNELPVDYENIINVEEKTKTKRATKLTEKSCESSVNLLKAFRKDTDLEEFIHIVHLSKEEQLEKIRLRKESVQYINATYKCEKCFLGFTYKRAQDKHARLHDKSRGSLACDVCQLRYSTPVQLKLHYSSHPKRYICRTCSEVFGTFNQARLHVLYHQGFRYKCPYCDEVYSNRSAYLNHAQSKHPADFSCCFCGNSFGSQFGLDTHKTLLHYGLDESEIPTGNPDCPDCAQCGVRFGTLDAFRRHLLTASAHRDVTDKFSCNKCIERFPTQAQLKEHKMAEHPWPRRFRRKDAKEANPWPIKCPHCSLEISSKMENWLHYKRQHPDKKYPAKRKHMCEVCGKGFMTSTALGYHMNEHTQRSPFRCEQCGKAFRQRNGLLTHRRVTHSAARPFACTDCGRAFKTKGSLGKHMRIHTGERPFKCDICPKAFAFNTTRKIHYRRVHLGLPDPKKEARRQRKLAKRLANKKT